MESFTITLTVVYNDSDAAASARLIAEELAPVARAIDENYCVPSDGDRVSLVVTPALPVEDAPNETILFESSGD